MISTKFHFDDGKMVTQRTQDCTPIIEQAKALHNEGHHGSNDFKHAASIPNIVLEAYCNRYGITLQQLCADENLMRQMLNDPDNSYLRIWKGRV